MIEHQYQDLIALFNKTFSDILNTKLVKGGDEPVYLPADEECNFHRILFAHGYFSSALHEISHWCIAGKKRRLLEDFGYWYTPDGRTAEQQKLFEQVEIKPQAIEWLLCAAVNKKFTISADNLNGADSNNSVFKQAVYTQVLKYIDVGLPCDAQKIIEVFAKFYQVQLPLISADFSVDKL